MKKRLQEFWYYCEFDWESGCINWTGTLSRGYGVYGSKRAHRISYELEVEPIPEGMTIDHLCRNKKCVNPDHLEVVTQSENTKRMMLARVPKPKVSKSSEAKVPKPIQPKVPRRTRQSKQINYPNYKRESK